MWIGFVLCAENRYNKGILDLIKLLRNGGHQRRVDD